MDKDSNLLGSPRKIRRLESTRIDSDRKFSQGSQESRATSTPTRRNLMQKLSISSDISSIAREPSVSLTNEEASNASESELLSGIGELCLTDKSSNYSFGSEILHRTRPQVFRGKTWNIFKPKHHESLYGKIFDNLDSIEDNVFEFLETLKSDEKKGSLILIKFFMDLCGYQEVSVDELFDFTDFSNSCERVIKMLESDLVTCTMVESKIYIFYEADRQTKLGIILAAAVHSFMEKLLIAAYGQNILFTKPFHKYIFQFLSYMCQSVLRSIRHTGVTLVRIILSVLNHIYPKIMKTSELEESQREPDDLSVEKQMKYLEKYIQGFFRIFIKNSFITDSKLHALQATNIKEMCNWMVDVPEIYFSNCISTLFKLQFDESELVRLSIIRVWKRLIKSSNVRSHVVEHVGEIVKLVKDRLHDVDLKVVVEAVDFFSVLLDKYPHAVSEDTTCVITELLYANSYLYGKAAAAFTIKCLSHAENTEKEILRKLVDISNIQKFQDMKFFFIESFAEHDTVLNNYKFMVDVLLSCSKDSEDDMIYARDLIHLMYYSVYQKLKGEAVIKRKHSVTAKPTCFGHDEVAKVFLLNLKDLINLFRDQISILNHLLRILLLINYDDLNSSYQSSLILLTKSSRMLFLNETDEEILENISKLYHYLYEEKQTSLKDHLHKFLVNLFENLSEYLKGYLESDSQEVEHEIHFMKIGKLYQNFNLNEYFDWNLIFADWKNRTLCRGQMTSCQYHILWTVKDFVTTGTIESVEQYRYGKINLSHHFNDYCSTLVEMLTSEVDDQLKLDAFESFCFVHLFTYEASMKDAKMIDFRDNIVNSLEAHVPEKMSSFLTENILQNESITHERRRKLICDWISLILNSLIDTFYLIPLFEQYHSKSEDYEALIEFVAGKIYERNPEQFFQIILATLIKMSSYIFQTSCRSLLSPEARELLTLAKKFSTMKEFSDSSQVLKMLDLGLDRCFREGVLELLIVFQTFLPNLTDEHCKDCLNIFIKLTPKKFYHKEYVKTFLKKLQGGKTRGLGRPINKSRLSSNLSLGSGESPITPIKPSATNSKEKIKKSSAFEQSSRENDENAVPKKKMKTPKSKKNK